MSTPLYSYSPRPQQVVSVELPPDGAGEALITAQFNVHTRVCVAIPDVAVPEVARGILAALHEAAGLPVPFVLDRQTEHTFRSWYKVDRRALGSVLINPEGPLSYSGTRRFAAALVGAVERAESEPDPAEVEALAEAIRGDERAFGGRPDHWAERAARAVLDRWTITERKPGGGGDG